MKKLLALTAIVVGLAAPVAAQAADLTCADFNAADVISNLGTGEALVSTLEGKGTPSVVQRTLIRPPSSLLGPLSDDGLADVLSQTPIDDANDTDLDRVSAYEMLAGKAQAAEDKQQQGQAPHQEDIQPPDGVPGSNRWSLPDLGSVLGGGGTTKSGGRQRETVVEAAMKSAARSVASSLGRALVRGILGSLKK